MAKKQPEESNATFNSEIRSMLEGAEHKVSQIPEFSPAPLNRWEWAAQILTDGVGSWGFTIFMAAIIAVWFFWNGYPALVKFHFDEFPFIFLNLALSAMAGFQAPIILMSQNAQYKRDLERDKYYHDIQVIMEAELRVAYDRLVNMELDVAVATEQMTYVQEDMKKDLSLLSERFCHITESSSEYKDRIDNIIDSLSKTQRTINSIGDEQTNISNEINKLKELFDSINKKLYKEETHNDRRK